MCQLKEGHEKRGVYYYAFQVIIGSLVKAFLVVSISLLTGSLIPAILMIGVFGSLRIFAGGYHMDTYGRCICTSLTLFIISSVFDQYTYKYWSNFQLFLLVAVTFIFSIAASIKWAPLDNPNRPITEPKEIKRFRTLTLLYEFIWLIASLAFIYFKIWEYKLVVIAGCFGVILEIFTITPVGTRFFDLIKGQLNKMGKQKKIISH